MLVEVDTLSVTSPTFYEKGPLVLRVLNYRDLEYYFTPQTGYTGIPENKRFYDTKPELCDSTYSHLITFTMTGLSSLVPKRKSKRTGRYTGTCPVKGKDPEGKEETWLLTLTPSIVQSYHSLPRTLPVKIHSWTDTIP